MSVFASAWAWQQPVSGNAKLVLLAFADECRGTDGLCWPGLKRVSDMVGIDVRSVRRQVELLEEKRLLVREERKREDGSQTSNLIRLLLAAEVPSPPDAAVRGGADAAVRPRAVEEGAVKSSEKKKKIVRPEEEIPGFGAWLAHHVDVAESHGLSLSVPRAMTTTRSVIHRGFAALFEEGYGLEEFDLASEGLLSSEWHRSNGHVKPVTVVRKPEEFQSRVDAGRRWRERDVTVETKYTHLDGA